MNGDTLNNTVQDVDSSQVVGLYNGSGLFIYKYYYKLEVPEYHRLKDHESFFVWDLNFKALVEKVALLSKNIYKMIVMIRFGMLV